MSDKKIGKKVGKKFYFVDVAKLHGIRVSPCEFLKGERYSTMRSIPETMIERLGLDKEYLIEKEYKGGVGLIGFDGKQKLPNSHDPFDALCYDFLIIKKGFKQIPLVMKLLAYNRNGKISKYCLFDGNVFSE